MISYSMMVLSKYDPQVIISIQFIIWNIKIEMFHYFEILLIVLQVSKWSFDWDIMSS